MEELSDALSEQQQILREVISLWKENELLWNPQDPNYKNRSKRQQAYRNIENKYKEYFPTSQEDYVKVRLDSMRSSYRREYLKVKASKNAGEKLYKPTLWYYDLLHFLAPDEDGFIPNNNEDSNTNEYHHMYWTREYSAYLIDIFKKYKCVYDPKSPGYNKKSEREDAYTKITNELMTKTNKKFEKKEVNKKIQLLKGQYRVESTKIKRSELRGGPLYKPSLWCFKLLGFLHVMSSRYGNTDNPKTDKRKYCSKSLKYDGETSDDEYIESVKMEIESLEQNYPVLERVQNRVDDSNSSSLSIKHQQSSENNGGDIFDTIGKNVAHKLRDMSEAQQRIAEKLLSEIMYHGQMEELNSKSRFSLEGE